jgi:hypothetical protein
MPKKKIIISADQKLEKLFEDFENEYLFGYRQHDAHLDERINTKESRLFREQTRLHEIEVVKNFIKTPCKCGNSCQKQFNLEEIIEARDNFNLLSWREKGCFLLPLLESFRINLPEAKSARMTTKRDRQKYVYRINSDRKVCRETFLFYYDISLKKLKYFQNHLNEVGLIPPEHGNIGKKPGNAYSEEDKNSIKLFMINFAATHGLPDPGRDLRTGVDKFKIFLPSAMSYRSVHQVYLKSLPKDKKPASYQSFIKIWQETTPNIEFQRPRTDMCKTCEDHIKNIRIAIGRKNEEEKIKYYKEALKHLKHVKKEREYYRTTIKNAQKTYQKLFCDNSIPPQKINVTSKFAMHYSWDFAQQLHYPYEDQQVGPIYFKTARKAQLFGVCCEGVPFQLNYFIDEADFLKKNANTVISLLDHFFLTHSLGESIAYLTADNCVSQNKNNPMIHYFLFRTMTGLHDEINLSFMIVGHTKFAPDGYFGLIKKVYRKSKVYTYNQLVELIQKASPNGHVLCQSFRNKDGKRNYQYYEWNSWFSKYFINLPEIKKYHHFSFNKTKPGEVTVKESIDGKEYTFNLLKNKKYRFKKITERPSILIPEGLSNERQWYLYDNIREHIPNEKDKNETCPLPKEEKKKK